MNPYTPENRPRAALFDAVSTLIHLREPVGTTYSRLAEPFGFSPPPGSLNDAFLVANRNAPPMLFPGETPDRICGLEKEWWKDLVWATYRVLNFEVISRDFERYFEVLWKHYSGRAAWTPAPGAKSTLSALRGLGFRTGVVSNFDHRLGPLLEDLGLAPFLDTVVLPANTSALKPDPRSFYQALESIGVEKSQAVFVGDHAVQDIAGARLAGLQAIDVSNTATLVDLVWQIPSILEGDR